MTPHRTQACTLRQAASSSRPGSPTASTSLVAAALALAPLTSSASASPPRPSRRLPRRHPPSCALWDVVDGALTKTVPAAPFHQRKCITTVNVHESNESERSVCAENGVVPRLK
eukprot:scaffold88800_cov69-Phaeocystis_antarctica.AAC.2